jgi:hypothetical protein
MARDGVDRLRQLSELFASLGRPAPRRWIIEYELDLLRREYCLSASILPMSQEALERRYGTFFHDGGWPARDAANQVAAPLERKRILQQKSV